MKKLKVGDTVMWSGEFGASVHKPAKVMSIELCRNGDKYGEPVNEVDWSQKDSITVDLDNGHWAYGDQIKPKQ